MIEIAFLAVFALAVGSYLLNRRAARQMWAMAGTGTADRPHSIASFHALYGFLVAGLPALIVLLLWLMLQGAAIDRLTMAGVPDARLDGLAGGERDLLLSEIKSIARGRVFGEPPEWKLEAAARMQTLKGASSALMVVVVTALGAGGMIAARRRVAPQFRARQGAEHIILGLMIACATVAIFVTGGIVASLLTEALRFFSKVPFTEFFFGLNWEPQIPIREGQVAAKGAFGWIPVLMGTVVVTVVAMTVAVPVGLFSAMYLHEFATHRFRAVAKPILEILAGVPTVVYGFFAILTVAPALRAAGDALGLPVAPNTALAAGGVMGIMLIPFIASFTDDALGAVPRALRDGALALGATRAEAMLQVLFPAAIPGIVGGVLLAVSRAIGETMIVVMAAGIMANLTLNPLDSVTTVTVQIVTLLIGDTSFDNPKTLAAFALGLMLFLVTLGINILALRIVRKYREIYD